jgi:Chaperone for flagella basal body P-ring formation
MTRSRSILSWMMAALAVLPAAAQGHRYSVTATQVAEAMTQKGIQVSAGQVTLLSDVMATSGTPDLQVQSVNIGSGNTAIARLGCAPSTECLPFIVKVRLSGGAAPSTPVENLESPRPASAPVQHLSASPAVRRNSQAVLLLLAPHMQIRIPVLCLENGSVGQTIRVTSPDHSKNFTAQVVGSGILRGML